MADADRVDSQLGRLGLSTLDERIVLAVEYGKLSDTTLGIKDAELGMLVRDDRGTVTSAADPDARPRRQLVGDFVDERRGVGHRAILHFDFAMAQTDVSLLVERYRAGWFGHDLAAIMSVVSDDIVFHNVTTGEYVQGAAAFRAHVAGIHDRWPDLSFDEHALYLTTDCGVAEWTARATAPDGRRIEWDGIDVINCRDGRITRNAVYSSGHAPRVLER
jgi:ketosteroid isomerase-like protein